MFYKAVVLLVKYFIESSTLYQYDVPSIKDDNLFSFFRLLMLQDKKSFKTYNESCAAVLTKLPYKFDGDSAEQDKYT